VKSPDVEVLPVGGEGLHLEHGLDQAADVRLEFFTARSAIAVGQDEEIDLVLRRAALEDLDDLARGVERGSVDEPARGIDYAGVDLFEGSIV
jgi:hypothetical protein